MLVDNVLTWGANISIKVSPQTNVYNRPSNFIVDNLTIEDKLQESASSSSTSKI